MSDATDNHDLSRRSVLKSFGAAAGAAGVIGASGTAVAATTIPVHVYRRPSVDDSYASDAVEAINTFGFYVDFEVDPQDEGVFDDGDFSCSVSSFENNVDTSDGHSYLLITDSCGAGYAWVGSATASSPGMAMVDAHGDRDVFQNAAIHEVAHTLDAAHEDGGIVRSGYYWDDTRYKTPMITTKPETGPTCGGNDRSAYDAYTMEPTSCTVDATESHVSSEF